MATRTLLKGGILLLSLLHIVYSRLAVALDLGRIRSDLGRCDAVVQQYREYVPAVFVEAVIAAEDHRNPYHRGVDPIGIARAAWQWLAFGKTQGASTIEQQFVRVVTGRYERSLARKVREWVLAIALAERQPKRDIAAAYLAIAYFGSGDAGLAALYRECGPKLADCQPNQVLEMVARLKYPRPHHPSDEWRQKIRRRAEYTARRLQ